jgi:cytochrome c peroxidase
MVVALVLLGVAIVAGLVFAVESLEAERLHPPSDSMGEPESPGVPSYASRSATKQYRTAPLKGVWQHAPYFHNGSATSLDDVVNIYNTRRSLGLTSQERADLVQYLKSL